MFSGLERERAALRRQRSVAWAWIKARGVMNGRPTPSHAKLTTSVLLTSDCSSEETANWRDSLAAITHRDLARQICDQFYDLSILYAWHDRSTQALTAERAVNPALPSYCTANAKDAGPQRIDKARILNAVFPEPERRGAVLLSIRSKAA